MAGHGFKDPRIAEYLKEAARRGIKQHTSGQILEPREEWLAAGKFILGFPDELISAADFDDGQYRFGYGNVNLVGRLYDGEFLSTEYPENIPVSTEIISLYSPGKVPDDGSDPIFRTDCHKVRVWNPRQVVINPEGISGCLRCPFYCGLPLLLIQQESNGDLVIVDVIEPDLAQVVQPTTTSTNIHYASCVGKCKMVYSTATKTWTKESDTCGTTSTTTSTTSTSTTSTTSPGQVTTSSTTPCLCPAVTTSSSSTTSSTTPNCNCNYPNDCGTYNGECRYTDCSQHPNQPPVCNTTTTTSSTTCDCNTSTTSSPGCNPGYCEWACSNGVWIPVHLVDCGIGCNPCSQPSGPCTPLDHCDPVRTYCVTPRGGSGMGTQCFGYCMWIYLDGWGWIAGGSVGCGVGGRSDITCECFAPSYIGADCERHDTPCAETGVPGGGGGPGACPNCYTTTTSTTTANCNTRVCRWKSNVGHTAWVPNGNNCLSACPQCTPPTVLPVADCQSEITHCAQGTTSTTTSTTSTTASPTTTAGPTTSGAPTTTTTSTSTTSSAPCGGPHTFNFTAETGEDLDYHYNNGADIIGDPTPGGFHGLVGRLQSGSGQSISVTFGVCPGYTITFKYYVEIPGDSVEWAMTGAIAGSGSGSAVGVWTPVTFNPAGSGTVTLTWTPNAGNLNPVYIDDIVMTKVDDLL